MVYVLRNRRFFVLEELFSLKQRYLNHFFKHLDLQAAENFLQALLKCRGTIVLTGVGKSGLIAKKIAVTMTSTGSRALYISPTNALHGDLGILSKDDLFIMLSKSGESDELLHLVPFLRNKGVSLLGIISNPSSRLAKACDLSMILPLEKELCPYNMAPTTSTSIQMIFGDVMAVALMKHQKFTLDAYALNHPAGSIGRKAKYKVKDLMLTGDKLPLCRPTDKLVDSLVELSNKRCGCLLVVDDQMMLKGIFTDGDLRRALLKQGADLLQITIEKVMSSHPRVVEPNRLAYEAVQLMEADPKRAITCMPVVDFEGVVQGLIRLHDIVQSGLV